MEKIEQKARQIFEDHNGYQSGDEFIAPMLEFARQMCEKQKEACVKNAQVVHTITFFCCEAELEKQSILNTKNVCE